MPCRTTPLALALAASAPALIPSAAPARLSVTSTVPALNAGGVTVQDIFDFLGAYFGSTPDAGFNGVGGVTVQDIFDFLGACFSSCVRAVGERQNAKGAKGKKTAKGKRGWIQSILPSFFAPFAPFATFAFRIPSSPCLRVSVVNVF